MDLSDLFFGKCLDLPASALAGGKTAGVEAWIADQPIAVTEVSRFGFVIVQRA
jgi:hypothetical protein